MRELLGGAEPVPVVGVVYSTRDPAGSGAAAKLLEALKERGLGEPEVRVLGFSEDVTSFDFLDERLGHDFYVVLSKHRSEAGIPCLTVHHTGNPTRSAELGGRPEELSWSFPRLAVRVLKELAKAADELALSERVPGLEVTYEVTHHGPTNLAKPLVFVEIGSSEREWRDGVLQEAVAVAVAETLSDLLKGSLPNCKRAAGFGGGHYARRFTQMALEHGYCFGHMIAKHAIREGVADAVLSQALLKNYEGVEVAVLERKAGPLAFRERLKAAASGLGVQVEVV